MPEIKCPKCNHSFTALLPPTLNEEEKVTTDTQKYCECIYESDCHGIEMIKSPSGKEWAIGGTKTQDRWKYCPWCGGVIDKPLNQPEPIRLCKCKVPKARFIDGWSHLQCRICKLPISKIEVSIQPEKEIEELEVMGNWDWRVAVYELNKKINEVIRKLNQE